MCLLHQQYCGNSFFNYEMVAIIWYNYSVNVSMKLRWKDVQFFSLNSGFSSETLAGTSCQEAYEWCYQQHRALKTVKAVGQSVIKPVRVSVCLSAYSPWGIRSFTTSADCCTAFTPFSAIRSEMYNSAHVQHTIQSCITSTVHVRTQ